MQFCCCNCAQLPACLCAAAKRGVAVPVSEDSGMAGVLGWLLRDNASTPEQAMSVTSLQVPCISVAVLSHRSNVIKPLLHAIILFLLVSLRHWQSSSRF